ncbi:hypothetical protein AB0C77_04405 [Streptomyces sp. NPDC048629]|uniref:hypothetical protein n=1 Tax=Streptomyces sp. NPDC048629 TaxID=3154824 RepID=UPI0034438CBA
MNESTQTRAQDTTPECRLDAHRWCRPGPVKTSYGDVVFTIKCGCTCHRRSGRQ